MYVLQLNLFLIVFLVLQGCSPAYSASNRELICEHQGNSSNVVSTIYGISPWYIARHGVTPGLKVIKERLDEWQDYGIDTIWLQPIFERTLPGQGYDVADYFRVWSELGNERDLQDLVKEAHKRGIKVLLDLPLAQMSIKHPEVQAAIDLGSSAPSYKKLLHSVPDDSLYGQHMQAKTYGLTSLVHVFWDQLVTIDYTTAEGRQFLLEVITYWTKNFGVDGFRMDAAWLISSQWPNVYDQIMDLGIQLTGKPLVLLAEDQVLSASVANSPTTDTNCYDDYLIFYDWTDRKEWVSRWAWLESGDSGKTIFNLPPENNAAKEFFGALQTSANEMQQGHDVLRFLENNDTPGILHEHTADQAEAAAKFMFTLPGVPLIFYGQEMGHQRSEPYDHLYLDPVKTIKDQSDVSVWSYYKKLVELRKTLPALSSSNLEPLGVRSSSDDVVAYVRSAGEQRLLVVGNLSPTEQVSTLKWQRDELSLTRPCLGKDLFTGRNQYARCIDGRPVAINLKPWQVVLLHVP